MGYDSLFIGRVDFQDLNDRKLKQNMEFVWKTSPRNLGKWPLGFHFKYYEIYFASCSQTGMKGDAVVAEIHTAISG